MKILRVCASGGLAALAVGICAAQSRPQEPSLDEVLANVRRALGVEQFDRHPRGIRLSGQATIFGNEGPIATTLLPDGRFVTEFHGPAPYSAGWNGKIAWQIALDPHPRILEFGEKAAQIIDGLALSGAWLGTKAPPLKLTLAALDGDAIGVQFENPDGFERGRIEIDARTWLPRIWTVQTSIGPQTTRFDDYKSVDGLRFPGTVSASGEGGMTVLTHFERCLDAPAYFRSPFDMPEDEIEDARFKGAEILEIERAPTGHLLVRPSINDEPAGWFLLDTGAATSAINTARAGAPRLEKIGSIAALGVGGTSGVDIVRTKSLQLGPLRITRLVAVGMDLPEISRELGRDVAGLVGYDIFSRCVVELDVGAGLVALHDPATFKGEGVVWGAMQLNNRMPVARAVFEGHDGLVQLDTGGVAALALTAPAVQRWRLLDGRPTEPKRYLGVGGVLDSQTGTLLDFEMGQRRFEAVDALFTAALHGAFADPYVVGVVGLPLLEKYTLLLDYPHARMALTARAETAGK